MKRILLICLIAPVLLYSCKKSSTPPGPLSGVYTEYSPVSGRTQLNFLTGNIVVESGPGIGGMDSFYYKISGSKIQLTPAWTNVYGPTSLDFWVLDNSTLKIENLYPSIPENPETFIILRSSGIQG